MSRFRRRFFRRQTFLAQVLCKLNDQNRVLGRLSNQQNKADLRIHVVHQTERVNKDHCPQQADRNRQQNGNGNHPAFVQSHQEQISKQECRNNPQQTDQNGA